MSGRVEGGRRNREVSPLESLGAERRGVLGEEGGYVGETLFPLRDRAEGEGGGRQLQRPGWAAADSFGDNNPVTFGIRDHALVVSVARPSWPIEKREPVALQSFCKGVDGGPRAQIDTQVCVPNELARAL